MDDDSASIAKALEQVGPRLKQLRAQRGVTLSALAESTGISKSTLSRLENGQRRASLELLATLPGEPLYRALGFVEVERVRVPLPGGVELPGAVMSRQLTPASTSARVRPIVSR